jgi:hypothetical protein
MRIRKRQVPLPFSSLSPVPLSDPLLLNRSPVVQLHLHDTTHPLQNSHNYANFRPQPSDQPNNQPIRGGLGCADDDASGPHKEENKKKNNNKDCLVSGIINKLLVNNFLLLLICFYICVCLWECTFGSMCMNFATHKGTSMCVL